MGLYNRFPKSALPKPLSEAKCLLCDSQMMPVDRSPRMDAFQYVCSHCNPNSVICVSGGLLASTLYNQLLQDSETRLMLHQEVRANSETMFDLSAIKVNKRLAVVA